MQVVLRKFPASPRAPSLHSTQFKPGTNPAQSILSFHAAAQARCNVKRARRNTLENAFEPCGRAPSATCLAGTMKATLGCRQGSSGAIQRQKAQGAQGAQGLRVATRDSGRDIRDEVAMRIVHCATIFKRPAKAMRPAVHPLRGLRKSVGKQAPFSDTCKLLQGSSSRTRGQQRHRDSRAKHIVNPPATCVPLTPMILRRLN